MSKSERDDVTSEQSGAGSRRAFLEKAAKASLAAPAVAVLMHAQGSMAQSIYNCGKNGEFPPSDPTCKN